MRVVPAITRAQRARRGDDNRDRGDGRDGRGVRRPTDRRVERRSDRRRDDEGGEAQETRGGIAPSTTATTARFGDLREKLQKHREERAAVRRRRRDLWRRRASSPARVARRATPRSARTLRSWSDPAIGTDEFIDHARFTFQSFQSPRVARRRARRLADSDGEVLAAAALSTRFMRRPMTFPGPTSVENHAAFVRVSMASPTARASTLLGRPSRRSPPRRRPRWRSRGSWGPRWACPRGRRERLRGGRHEVGGTVDEDRRSRTKRARGLGDLRHLVDGGAVPETA